MLSEVFTAGGCTEVEALDLQARIDAQQGMLLRAESCWRKAQSLDPENPAHADALASLRRSQRPFWGWWRIVAGAGLAILLLGALSRLAAMRADDARDRQVMAERLGVLERKLSGMDGQALRFQETMGDTLPRLAKATDLTKLAALQKAVAGELSQARAQLQRLATGQEQLGNGLQTAVGEAEKRLKADSAAHRDALIRKQTEAVAAWQKMLAEAERRMVAQREASSETVQTAMKSSAARLEARQQASLTAVQTAMKSSAARLEARQQASLAAVREELSARLTAEAKKQGGARLADLAKLGASVAESVGKARDEVRRHGDTGLRRQGETLARIGRSLATLEAAREAAEEERRQQEQRKWWQRILGSGE